MPPAGRAPPCTRWGASRPPDPGITADAKGFRIQLALDTEPFCVRRLVFVGSPPFEVTVTRSIFVINTKNPRMRYRGTFNKPRHAASPQPSSAPLTKVFEEEGGGLEGGGETFWRKFPLPLPKPHPLLFKDFRVYRIPVGRFFLWAKNGGENFFLRTKRNRLNILCSGGSLISPSAV